MTMKGYLMLFAIAHSAGRYLFILYMHQSRISPVRSPICAVLARPIQQILVSN